MYFNLDEDSGDRITGWFLPDNPSRIPTFLIEADGRSCVVAATHVHTNMIASSQHDTGRVGFEVTSRQMPGLEHAIDVRVTERESGLCFYTRPKARRYADGRLFAFEMREGGDSFCSFAFGQSYRAAFPDLHRFGQDTRKGCYQVRYTESIYAGGAPCVRADEPFLMESHFRRVALLADPLRLMFDLLVPELDPNDATARGELLRRIGQMSRDDRRLLSEPLTRRLSLFFVNDPLERDAVAQALETLSGFDAVGVEDYVVEFVELTAAICEVDTAVYALPAPPPPFPLSKILRREPQLVELAGRDLDIYDAVYDAIAEAHGQTV